MREVAFDGEVLDFSGLLDIEDIVRSPDLGVRNLEDDWSSFSGTPLTSFRKEGTDNLAVKHYGVFDGLNGDSGKFTYGKC